ncbi:MAG: SAM-dependent methyltransferase [Bdellovibrio sp.]|nr:MAG: SAM-dependent methyltransferase [Bdellovibrio sp.]
MTDNKIPVASAEVPKAPTWAEPPTQGSHAPITHGSGGADGAAHASCRFCGTSLEVTFADLGVSPVSNAFLPPDALARMERFFPLHARVCSSCFLVQVDDVASAEHHFHDNYAYFSSFSTFFVRHAELYVEKMMAEQGIGPGSRVIEIASNDGYLLQHFVRRGVPCLGIEPSANVAREAEKKGVKSWVKFFGVQTAKELCSKGWAADLLLGNNVVAHVPDVNDFVEGLRIALKTDGLITLEFPHLLRLIEENQFDTIYHEHFSYFSLHTLSRIFTKHELTIFDVEELPTHGGSLRIYARHANSAKLQSVGGSAQVGASGTSADATGVETDRYKKVLRDEVDAGLFTNKTYQAFADRILTVKYDLLEFLIGEKRKGKRVVAYGAPAKGNTLLNYCGIRPDLIPFTVDRNTFKQGLYLPGTRIPIKAPEAIHQTRPDYVIVLPWNIKEEIIQQMADIKTWGGKFVTAIPKLQVWEAP